MTKYTPDEKVQKYGARLVAKGYLHEYGVDMRNFSLQ